MTGYSDGSRKGRTAVPARSSSVRRAATTDGAVPGRTSKCPAGEESKINRGESKPLEALERLSSDSRLEEGLVEAAGIEPGAEPKGKAERLIRGDANQASEARLVEAAGIEPASESTSPQDSTCVSALERFATRVEERRETARD
jgi:hypothetical protein